MKYLYLSLLTIAFFSCKEEQVIIEKVANKETKTKSVATIKEELISKGFQVFDYVDEETKDTVIMQQYFMAFLKSGPNRDQSKATADSLQTLHLAHLGKMYKEGYADISGPLVMRARLEGLLSIIRQLWKWQIALPILTQW